MRVVVFQVNRLGDFVAMLPTLGGLRRMLPDARISIVTSHAGAELLREGHLVDEVFSFDFGRYRNMWKRPGELLSLTARFRKRHFAASISAHDECTTSALLARLAQVPVRIGFRGTAKGDTLHTHHLIFDSDRHVTENRYATLDVLHDALGGLDRVPPLERVSVRFSSNEDASFRKRYSDLLAAPYIAFHPLASLPHKAWPATRATKFIQKVLSSHPEVRVVILTGTERYPVANLNSRVMVIPNTSLRELAWLLGMATVFVGNNSGPMNLALAMGTPVAAVTGPSPEWWWPSPFRDVIGVVVKADIDCIPCEVPGQVSKCRLGLTPSPCMSGISVEMVLDATLNLLARPVA